MQNPTIAVSRCLLGENVRYDGEAKAMPELIRLLESYFSIVGVCPEVEIGLSVPRPPVQLIKQVDAVYARGIDNPALDVTQQLTDYARKFAQQHQTISAYVLKAKSPSCGFNTTPLLNDESLTSGIFAAEIHRLNPHIPIRNETHLDSSEKVEEFVLEVQKYECINRSRNS